MEGIFAEFENENALRSYPFAAGCERIEGEKSIPAGTFVDAMLYPVNPVGTVYLSGISEDGAVLVSDDSGVIMSGVQSGSVVEMYDTSALRRHVGTLVAAGEGVLAEFLGRRSQREYEQAKTAFASSCVFPVCIDGVRSLSVGGVGPFAGVASFSNGVVDPVRVSSATRADGRQTIRFDVVPRPAFKDDRFIRRIICVVDGRTPFRITKTSPNTVMVWLDGVDRGAVCSAARREDAYEMADTCSCEKKPFPTHEDLPFFYRLEEVYVPPDEGPDFPEGGIEGGMDNAFYFVVPNVPGYENPLSITLEDGEVIPKTSEPAVVVNGADAELAEGETVDEMTSKCVVIQVPGLGGGKS